MALVYKQNEDAWDDITYNLPSLQFENALSNEEKKMLFLRKRSHAITSSALAQATYFISILNDCRQINQQLVNPSSKQSCRLLQDVIPRNPVFIGIIGCGRLGSHLANCLLTFADVQASEIKISTRRPDTLKTLREKGVMCFYDNAQVASSVHVLFICLLPTHFPMVAEEIKGQISPNCLVYSFISSTSVVLLKQLLGFNNIIRPEFTWKPDNENKMWDYTMDMAEVLSSASLVEHTCPLSTRKDDALICTNEKFAELMICALINMAVTLGIIRSDLMDMINGIVLGETPKNRLEQKLTEEDICTHIPKDSSLFPKFDLFALVDDQDTPLIKKLVENSNIRGAFVRQYCNIFQQSFN